MPPLSSQSNITRFFKPSSKEDARPPSLEVNDGTKRSSTSRSNASTTQSSFRPVSLSIRSPTAERGSARDAIDPTSPLSPIQTSLSPASSSMNDMTTSPGTGAPSSSAPNRSFASTTSSKRAIRNGVEIIRPSDSDEDSDSSLADLVELYHTFNKQSGRTSIKSREKLSPKSPTDRVFRSSTSATKTLRQRNAPKAIEKPKFSLASLVKSAQTDAKREEEIARIKAILDAPTDSDDSETRPKRHRSSRLDTKTIALALDGEESDEVERLEKAVKRTNALQQDPCWHFFQEKHESRPSPPFPKLSDSNSIWARVFQTPPKRDDAFITGFVERMASRHSLPDEVYVYMLEYLSCDPRDDLASSYLKVLQTAPMNDVLTSSRLKELLRGVGAGQWALDFDHQLVPEPKSPKEIPECTLSRGLSWILRLLQYSASGLSDHLRGFIIVILMRMSLDDTVSLDCEISRLVNVALSTLFSNIEVPEPEYILGVSEIIFNTTTNTLLQAKLIQVLPSQTPILHRLRRRLALSFGLTSAEYLDADLTNPILMDTVIRHLRTSPEYMYQPHADYVMMRARVFLLDTALDSGFSSLLFPAWRLPSAAGAPSNGTTSLKAPLPLPVITPSSPKRGTRPSTDPGSESTFNASAAALSDSINRISARLDYAGPQDLARMEVYGTLSRWQLRVEHAVRTKERKKRVWFEDRSAEEEKQKRAMEAWLEEQKGSKAREDNAEARAENDPRSSETQAALDDQLRMEMES
ncbi:hypothetical protein P152DRAFT_458495 [Eremomyces bilateralis CBS 781.70]|uniref:Uncharacterized protein n=1 Tax=Eremomyces bilateralis CBS 781.70 TaxID=1392243 RepID=A0A6G1G3P2_9PEZI|nr:uncharacterized protein P152DRAFT_458495 [Eremomyces bilateralis CBS 781.70]KAF1812684.1 hypothetical protein P152DRAFT_458495 [Eremomyces bilateralis CBS 781.70]